MKKVLIVDDDSVFRNMMSEKLRQAQYEVIFALDGEEGVRKALTEKPDVILLDIRMPRLDGIGFLKQLNEKKGDAPSIPVFITSNISAVDKISEGVSLGVRGYIIKSAESLDTILTHVNHLFTPAEVKQVCSV